MMKKTLLLTLLISLNAWADPVGLSADDFRIAGLMAVQNQGSNTSYSFMASWNPEYHWTEKFGMSLSFGATGLETVNRKRYFVAEYLVMADIEMAPNNEIEIGGGQQNWVDEGGWETAFSANYVYKCKNSDIKADRFVLGYVHTQHNSIETHQFKAGFGFSF